MEMKNGMIDGFTEVSAFGPEEHCDLFAVVALWNQVPPELRLVESGRLFIANEKIDWAEFRKTGIWTPLTWGPTIKEIENNNNIPVRHRHARESFREDAFGGGDFPQQGGATHPGLG